jgi:multiple sugar transport system ATP-binding protein
MADLSLKHVKKVYQGNVVAVDDFNLDIEEGEFLVMVGPSGCGKTTTLRMIAGLETISEGELYIDGNKMNEVPPKNRDIAMVFQNYALYPHMTVYENMAFGLKMRKMPKGEIDRRVKEAAGILQIDGLLKRKPSALSGGQRQRVALGRAFVRHPRVFLMDEPLSNLDAKLRVATREELIRLHRQLQTTFIYVTHDQTEALTMGTKIVVMRDGRIQQCDSPQNLYDRPGNRFVAEFIGSPQMNVVQAALEEENGKMYARFGNSRLLIPEGVSSALRRSAGGNTVYLGIRPENFRMGEGGLPDPADNAVRGTVDLVEPLGSDTYIHFGAEGADKRLTARIPPHITVKNGASVQIAVDAEKLHFFDVKSEKAIG